MGYLKYEVYFTIALFPLSNLPNNNCSESISYWDMFNEHICNENQIGLVLKHLENLQKKNYKKSCHVRFLEFAKEMRECFKCECLIEQLQNECDESDCEDDGEELDECLRRMIIPKKNEFSDEHINIDGKSYAIKMEIDHCNKSYVKTVKKVKEKINPKIGDQSVTANTNKLLNENANKKNLKNNDSNLVEYMVYFNIAKFEIFDETIISNNSINFCDFMEGLEKYHKSNQTNVHSLMMQSNNGDCICICKTKPEKKELLKNIFKKMILPDELKIKYPYINYIDQYHNFDLCVYGFDKYSKDEDDDNELKPVINKVTTTIITSVTTITTVNGVSTSSTVTTTEVK